MHRFLFALTLWVITSSAGAETLRWGFSPTDPEPYIVMQGAELGPSMTRSLGELVARQLGREILFVEVPNNRLDRSLRGGRIDLACNTVPAWLSAPNDYLWSKPLYRDADIIVTRAGRSVPGGLDEMQGMRVGTAHDQNYSHALLQAFQQGHLQRMDVRDMRTRLGMVEHERLDASVERRSAMRYHLKQYPDSSLAIAPWTLSELPLRCAAEQKHRPTGKQALKALDRLTRDDRIEALLADFGLGAIE